MRWDTLYHSSSSSKAILKGNILDITQMRGTEEAISDPAPSGDKVDTMILCHCAAGSVAALGNSTGGVKWPISLLSAFLDAWMQPT
jgi:hypothetical protein